MIKQILLPWKRYAVFEGRASRKEFWPFTLVNMVIIFTLSLLSTDFSLEDPADSDNMWTAVYFIFIFAAFLPSIGVQICRLHDTGKNGAFVLLNFIPVIGGLIVLFLCAIKGEAQENQYGPPPMDEPEFDVDEVLE